MDKITSDIAQRLLDIEDKKLIRVILEEIGVEVLKIESRFLTIISEGEVFFLEVRKNNKESKFFHILKILKKRPGITL